MKLVLSALALLAFTTISCADLPTAPGGKVAVSGSILDRDGGGIAEAQVYFSGMAGTSDGYPQSFVATTNASGAYEITLIGGRYTVYVDAPGYVTARLPAVDLTEDHERLDHRFTGVRVSGQLDGPAGALLPNAQGYVYGDYGYGRVLVSSGTYSILLPPGTYYFRFDSGDNTLGLPQIEMPQVPVSRDTTIDVHLDGHLVTGVVHGPGSTPLVGAFVGANSVGSMASNRTTLSGDYVLRLPTGGYTFRVYPPPGLSFIATRSFGPYNISQPTTLDFDLSGVEWTGVVRRAQDSTVVASASIYASSDGTQSFASTTSDATGAFRLIVRPGTLYRIRAAADLGRLASPEIGVIAGADSSFDLYLRPGTPPIIYIDAPKKPSPYAIPSGGARWAGMRGGMPIVSE